LSTAARHDLADTHSIAAAGHSRKELERQFERLLEENGPALSRLAASYTRTTGDRDDLLQEIATALWLGLPQFRRECSERTFLFRIAHNRAISHLSRNRGAATVSDEAIQVSDSRPDPEAGLAQRQQQSHLLVAVQQLPVIYRETITLMLEGMSYSEIAEILGIAESNVGARLNRARQMLRELLEVKK